jgi:CRISPR-associated endonuclease/helicase Cas3
MLRAVRAAVIVADCAGSGLPREGKTIAPWVREGFFERRSDHDTPDGRMTVDTIGRAIIAPRMEKMGITPEQLNAFQIACGDPDRVPERALLLAPCGSGKTLAAWRWVAARCAERPRRRAIFLYPTRGTATEGYRDYVALAGPEEAALDHGTADLDLDGIHADVPDEDRINQARLFALRQWPKRLFSATVDQFLGFLQHGYGPTCHLPLLADSVVVCDEVHSYDRGMFSALIEFLRHFDVPVLCMTATMLQDRRDRLLQGGPELGSDGLAYVNGLGFGADAGNGESGLRRAAEHPRYATRRAADEAAAEDAVRAALADRKRVLWVVNNVDRCQSLASKFAADVEADTLTAADGYPLFCYHSRFRLKDRKRWHEAVVHAFKPKDRGGPGGPVLAVTTQVCEMSLDLDADVLVTEVCPGTALVQRMGRCCRDAKAHQSGRTGVVIIYEPPGEDARVRRLPYAIQDLAGVDELIDVLTVERMVSQGRLEHLLLQLPAPAELPKACRFIDSGAWAAAGEEQFRDGDDFTRPAVLINPLPGERESDADAYARIWNPKTRRKTDRPWDADALVINVPTSKGGTPHVQAHNGYDLPKWLHWAINGTYSKTLGFRCGLAPAAWIV